MFVSVNLKNQIRPFIAVFLTGALLAGCGPKIGAVLAYKESPVEVYRAHTIGKDGTPVDAGYQHPLELSPSDVFKIIRSVQVQIEPGKIQKFIAKSEAQTGPAFSSDDAASLAPGLSKALAGATPGDRIHFQVNHPNLFHGGTLSSGVLFVKGDRVQIILQNIRHAPGAGDYDKLSRFREPEKLAYSQNLVILPGPHQMLSPTTEKRLKSRWVSIDHGTLLSTLPEPDFGTPSGKDLNGLELEKKLETLKDWRDRGLISKEVYQEKQEKLLQGF